MKRTYITQHARASKDYTDLTLDKVHIKRRAAVVYTMLQASVRLSLVCTAVI